MGRKRTRRSVRRNVRDPAARYAAAKALAEGGATEGERAAARKAMKRMEARYSASELGQTSRRSTASGPRYQEAAGGPAPRAGKRAESPVERERRQARAGRWHESDRMPEGPIAEAVLAEYVEFYGRQPDRKAKAMFRSVWGRSTRSDKRFQHRARSKFESFERSGNRTKADWWFFEWRRAVHQAGEAKSPGRSRAIRRNNRQQTLYGSNETIPEPKPVGRSRQWVDANHCDGCNMDYRTFRSQYGWDDAIQVVRAANGGFDQGGGWRSRGPVLWAWRVLKLTDWYGFHQDHDPRDYDGPFYDRWGDEHWTMAEAKAANKRKRRSRTRPVVDTGEEVPF